MAVYLGLNIKVELSKYFGSVLHLSVLYYGTGMTSYHLWYLTALIWSIVILFLFLSYKKLNLLLFLSLGLNLIGLFGQSYAGIYHLGIPTRDALFFGLFYTTLGCFFANHYEYMKLRADRLKTSLLVILFFLFSIAQIIERAIVTSIADGTNGGEDYYLSTIPMAVCLFLLILKHRHWGRQSLISMIGMNAVGVYVTHMFFISMTFLAIDFLGIDQLKKSALFLLAFSLIVVFASHYFYILIQLLKLKIKSILFENQSYKQQKLRKSS